MMSRSILKLLIAVLLAAFAFAAYGCMAGYRTTTKNGHETVYRVDDDGTKTMVYEVSKDGELTVHDESDPRAQQMMEAKANMERSKAADEERIQRIMAAPKRAAGEPIFVALYEVELGPKLKESQHSEGAVTAEVMKNFQSDETLRLVSANEVKGNEWAQLAKMYSGKSSKTGPPSDVNVVSKAYLKEKFGISQSTGKPASAWYLVYEAVITCNYVPAEYRVTEEGNMFRNTEVTKSFTDKIKHVIKTQIGPTLPADRSL